MAYFEVIERLDFKINLPYVRCKSLFYLSNISYKNMTFSSSYVLM